MNNQTDNVKILDYSKERRACPECGSKKLLIRNVASEMMVVYKPRECQSCGYLWLPQPPKSISILYLLMGVFTLVSGIGCLILIPILIHDWMTNDMVISIVHAGIMLLFLAGSYISIVFGKSLVLMGLHIIKLGKC